jgi:hypothetical protein
MKLELKLDSEGVRPGGSIRGRVLAIESCDSRSLTLTITQYEKTRDYVVAAGSSSTVLHEGDVVAGQAYDFDFTLANDAAPSTKTKNGELYWELEVKSDESGLDTHLTRRFTVA